MCVCNVSCHQKPLREKPRPDKREINRGYWLLDIIIIREMLKRILFVVVFPIYYEKLLLVKIGYLPFALEVYLFFNSAVCIEAGLFMGGSVSEKDCPFIFSLKVVIFTLQMVLFRHPIIIFLPKGIKLAVYQMPAQY